LDEIPGVDWTLAAVIIAELGVDMSVFASVSQLASWAGVCPGNNESAGKRKSSRIPSGNVYLKSALVEAANAAARAKGTYLRDKFFRLKARRGYKRSVVAIAHKILEQKLRLIARKLNYDSDELLAKAGRIASDLSAIITRHPRQYGAILRSMRKFKEHDFATLIECLVRLSKRGQGNRSGAAIEQDCHQLPVDSKLLKQKFGAGRRENTKFSSGTKVFY
jgi:hypothetical protein